MAAGLKTEMDHRSQVSGDEYGKYYALFGDRNLSKDFKMTHCGFPLLQPVIALEFFQHRILRSNYLNFLEEFFIVFISDIFGKFRKSHDHSKLPRINMNHGTRKATHVISIGRR